MRISRNTLLQLLLIGTVFLWKGFPAAASPDHLPSFDSWNCLYFTPAEGLSHQQVSDIVEDQNGSIWIATRIGVDRLDGPILHSYTLPRKSPYGGVTIRLLLAGHTLWAYNSEGEFYRFETAANRFVPVFNLWKEKHESQYLTYVLPVGQTCFWAFCRQGIHPVQTDGTPIRPLITGPRPYTALIHRQTIYLATEEGVDLYTPDGRFLKHLWQGGSVRSLCMDSIHQILWAGTFNQGLKALTLPDGQERHSATLSQIPHLPVRTLTRFNPHTLLAGLDGAGVYAIRTDGTCATQILNADTGDARALLRGNAVYALCTDREGSLWVGSYTGGAACLRPRRYPYTLTDNPPHASTGNHINRLCQDSEKNLWMATNNGICLRLHSNGQWKHFLAGKVFLTLCPDGAQGIWAGGYGTGLYHIHPTQGILEHLTATVPNTLTTDYIYSLATDSDGSLWIGGIYGSLLRYAPREKHPFTSYGITFVNAILPAGPDELLAATTSGLWKLHKPDGQVTRIRPGDADFTWQVYRDPQGNLWTATDGLGIKRYNPTTGELRQWTRQDGLPSDCAYGLLPDKQGNIWISTDRGLARLDAQPPHTVTHIGFLDDDNNEMNSRSFGTLAPDLWVYAGRHGAICFHPDSITPAAYTAPLRFTAIEVAQPAGRRDSLRATQLNGTALRGETLRLRYNENTLYAAFVATSFLHRKEIRYTCKLEGFDSEWSSPSTQTGIRYTNLPPGSYRLRVRSITQSGIRLAEISLPLTISRPPWDTPAAWVAYTILALLALLLLWRYVAQRIRQRHFREKMDFFIHAAHDIRTPVTLVVAPLDDLARSEQLTPAGQQQLALARRNAGRLHEIVTQLLDFQQTDHDGFVLQARPTDLRPLVQEKATAFQPLCRQKEITLGLQLPTEPAVMKADREKMEKILENLLSNAVKYTPSGGNIRISLTTEARRITLQIADTGIGIPQKEQHRIFSTFYRARNATNANVSGSGIGQLFTRRLVELHDGRITFDSREGEGTTFRLTFPVCTPDPQPVSQADTLAPDAPHIVLVEDNDDLREYLTSCFARQYHTSAFADAERALEHFAQGAPADLVISDVMLPGLQGDELCRKLKESFGTSHIPVLLLTARTAKEDILSGYRSGADAYLAKPFDTEVLLSKTAAVLENRRRMQDFLLTHPHAPAAPPSDTDTDTDSDTPAESPASHLAEADLAFLSRCHRLVMEHLRQTDFDINSLCRELALSRTLLYNKLKGLTGKAPADYVRTLRMNEAARLLTQQVPVQEVASRTGFTDAKYFSTAFKKHFGIPPSLYTAGAASSTTR